MTRRRATRLLPIWICSCQSEGTVIYDMCDDFNFHVTNFLFLSRHLIFARLWCFSSQLIRLSTPGLAPLMNVLFWRCYFPISFSGRNMSRNDKHRSSTTLAMSSLYFLYVMASVHNWSFFRFKMSCDPPPPKWYEYLFVFVCILLCSKFVAVWKAACQNGFEIKCKLLWLIGILVIESEEMDFNWYLGQ